MINFQKTKQRGGDRESAWKRIQNNDSKDDPKWKQNGVTGKYKVWEDIRNAQQDPRIN